MAKDERFTVVAVVLASLITAGAFLWSHWGSLAFSVRPKPVAETSGSVPQPETPGAATAAPETLKAEDVVAAVFEIQPEATGDLVQASNSVKPFDDRTKAVLEDLASGWAGSALPEPAEVLVRKDRDGRTVVASGTHRRYNDLRQQVQGLTLSDIEEVLLQVEKSSDPAEVQSLRNALIDSVDAVLAVDLPEVEPDMVAGVHAWQFSDADYRALTQSQQHLLLMGKNNAQAVRAKLVEIRHHLAGPNAPTTDQPAIGTDPIVIAHSPASEDPVDAMIQP